MVILGYSRVLGCSEVGYSKLYGTCKITLNIIHVLIDHFHIIQQVSSFHQRGNFYWTLCKMVIQPLYQPKPKPPYAVLVWAWISMKWATDLSIFTGKMKAPFYRIVLLRDGLKPSILELYPDHHRLMQDKTGGNPPPRVSWSQSNWRLLARDEAIYLYTKDQLAPIHMFVLMCILCADDTSCHPLIVIHSFKSSILGHSVIHSMSCTQRHSSFLQPSSIVAEMLMFSTLKVEFGFLGPSSEWI